MATIKGKIMARGINKVIIVGNLGTDPETRTFPDGGSLTNISVATSEQWTDKQTGQKMERTEWHRIQFGNRLAEVAAQYLRKGSKVYVEGSLRTRKYQDKTTGADRYATDIRGSVMQMLDSLQPGQAPQQPAPAQHRNRRRLEHIKMLSKAAHRPTLRACPILKTISRHRKQHRLQIPLMILMMIFLFS